MATSISVYPDLPKTGYLRLPQILRFFPIGRSSWWLGVKTGKYPQPIKLGPRTTVWRAEDIRALIDSLAENGGAQEC